jgi:8-oxo-dGTP pyrophosphatase MutT (NUDIX family)
MNYASQPPHGQAVRSDPYFTLMADADGVGFIHCGDAVAVVPVTNSGDVLLAVEYSPAFGREILTLVSGSIEPGESLEEAANRELQEELGYHAGRLDFLGELHPFKYLTTRVFVFLARELTPSMLAGDESHPIGVRPIPLAQFMARCQSGELQDAVAIAGLCWAQTFVEQVR